jgi:hypothetical protein
VSSGPTSITVEPNWRPVSHNVRRPPKTADLRLRIASLSVLQPTNEVRSIARKDHLRILGQQVVTRVKAVGEPGYKSVDRNAAGVASRVYFYRLKAGEFVQTRKLVVLK